MSTVGIYVDGPNIERSLYEADEIAILERVASILVEYASSLGDIIDRRAYVDENTQWRSERTRDDYHNNGFDLVESRSFKYIDERTGMHAYEKSLTDPTMHCSIIDRLHDNDCPDVLMLVTGDKDITVVLDHIAAHGRSANVVGEANSISNYLVSRCGSLHFECHIIQLISRSSKAMERQDITTSFLRPTPHDGLRLTDAHGKVVDPRRFFQYRNDRSNQLNPNNVAYWLSRGFSEKPPDWEQRTKEEDTG